MFTKIFVLISYNNLILIDNVLLTNQKKKKKFVKRLASRNYNLRRRNREQV